MSTRKSKSGSTTTQKHHLQDLLDVRTSLDLLDNHKTDDAKALCNAVLARTPNLVFAQHARGLVALKERSFVEAEKYLRKAVSLDPANDEYITNLANAILKQDRIEEAIKLYEQAISINTESKDARIGLANALHEKNDPDASIAYFEDAVRREPTAPGPLSHLGRALTEARRYNEAVTTILKSLELQINFAPAHTALGETFYAMGMLKESLESHKTALLLDPNEVYAHSKIADTYIKLKEPGSADEHYQRIIEIAPKDPNNYAKLANSYAQQERYEEALALFQQALQIDPTHALTHNNLGVVMHDNGNTDEAITHFNRAIAFHPTYQTAIHNLALSQLLYGDLKTGWANHESRLIVRERSHVYRTIHKVFQLIPKWDGVAPLAGKHIFLLHEQGFGDSIQFARYALMLEQQGATVSLHVKDALFRLFKSLSPNINLIKESDPIPKADYAYVLMSLPHALGTDTVDDIPPFPRYLAPAAEDAAVWKDKIVALCKDKQALRVGFVWGGNPEHGNDRRRSIPLHELEPLFNMEGVEFFSLQKGAPTADLKKLPPTLSVHNVGEECKDFEDTAAAISALDVVISVDTSVVHLAGAIGTKTLTLLAYTPDWRWLYNREDSPWYPSMKLIRQPERGDWASVVHQVENELTALRDARV